MIEPIVKKIVLNAPAARVWKAITDPSELASWMLMPTDFIAEVGKDFTFNAGPHGNWDGIIKCSVKEIEEPQKLVFTWNAEVVDTETVVAIELKDMGEKTELTLTHSGWDNIPVNKEESRKAHNEGWEVRIMNTLPEYFK